MENKEEDANSIRKPSAAAALLLAEEKALEEQQEDIYRTVARPGKEELHSIESKPSGPLEDEEVLREKYAITEFYDIQAAAAP